MTTPVVTPTELRDLIASTGAPLEDAPAAVLRNLAAAAGVPRHSRMRKADLLAAVQAAAADAHPDCPACAAGSSHSETYVLEPLSPELTDGLTTWGSYGGAQIRVESPFLTDTAGEPLTADGLPLTGPPIGCLYIAFRDDAYQSSEDGHPYRLDLADARRLRDLLNIATARGVL